MLVSRPVPASWLDPKSHLQELVQNQQGFTPIYKVIEESGPDHNKTFVVACIIKDDKIAFVEVKDGRDKLRDNQRKILDVLTTAGLKCFVWTPANGFQKYIKSPVR